MIDATIFDHIVPSDEQKEKMDTLRMAAAVYADVLDMTLPAGPDKTYLLRKLREVAMWANVTVIREADGSPRE